MGRHGQSPDSRDSKYKSSKSSSKGYSRSDHNTRKDGRDHDLSKQYDSKDKQHRSHISPSRKSRYESASYSNTKDHKSRTQSTSSGHHSKSSKHKRKSSSSSSSESSADSEKELRLLRQLAKERERKLNEKKKLKELAKANETPEEKRLRRLMKKEAKERKRKEQMGWDTDYMHYTNSDNPFGDSNLLTNFKWEKKLNKEGLSGASEAELSAQNRKKMGENKRELEKVKQRRLEREAERAARDEEMAQAQRSKEAVQFEEWQRQEDLFHLEQARLRSTIRIQEGRAKPIDLLAKYISSETEVDAVEMHEPYTYLHGLNVQDLEDLLADIQVYRELEMHANDDYWDDISIILEDELHGLRKQDDSSLLSREGISKAVAEDVASVFKGKTSTQLNALQTQIETKISAKADNIDIGYWETLLSQLKAHMARSRLRERHQQNLRRKLELLKAEQGVVKTEKDDKETHESARDGDSVKIESIDVEPGEEEDSQDSAQPTSIEREEERDEASEVLGESFSQYETGGYSPKYLPQSRLEPGTLVYSEEDDNQRLVFARLQVQRTGNRVENVITAEEKALQREARKGMAGDEAEFSVESLLDPQVYLWSDKYRPRKPRYFNRVHTGFEWNKYNQTHYDMDNPPPKIVQGYKFNIFYPDLIDKNSTPQYFLTTCGDNADFAILRFHAGPPYEDIGFKIVNREWEYSYKRGFRCQFHNNIFQLWFHFKRYRYRR